RTSLMPGPVTGHIKILRMGRRAGARDLGQSGRRGKIRDRLVNKLLFSCGPEAGHPMPLLAVRAPIARDPALVRRRRAPGAADPKEIAAFIIPGPVAADPGCAFWLLVGR